MLQGFNNGGKESSPQDQIYMLRIVKRSLWT